MLFAYTPQMQMRRPASCRIVKPAPQAYGLDQLLYSPYMQPYYARREPSPVANLTRELAPLFQLFENALETLIPTPEPEQKPATPHFDARQTVDAYEVRGELPGIEAEDIHVEFTDPQTLVVRGSYSMGQSTQQAASAPAEPSMAPEAPSAETIAPEPAATAAPAVETTQPADEWTMIDSDKDNDARSLHSDSASSSYHKPTVEDEESGKIESTSAPLDQPPQAKATAVDIPAPQASQERQQAEQHQSAQAPALHQSNDFQQTFKFQSRIDQDAVRALFKDGVLEIRVPKVVAPRTRTIVVY